MPAEPAFLGDALLAVYLILGQTCLITNVFRLSD